MSDPFSNSVPSVDPDDFLMSGGSVSAKFPKIGHSYTGIVLSKRSEQQRDYDDNAKMLFWDNGKPKMQVIVELQTDAQGTFDRNGNPEEVEDDDGIRSFYVRGEMQRAIRDGVRRSGAQTLELFGKLTITHSAIGKQDNPRYNPPKLYKAEFIPASRIPKNDPLLLLALADKFADDPFSAESAAE